jgi:hypothetical protein
MAYKPKKIKCAKCDDWRVPGTGQKYCAAHKLTRNGDSQGSAAQKAGRYNLSMDQLEAMEADQGGRCAICGDVETTKGSLSVDHDHNCCPGTGSCGECVRGLLCSNCNRALGLLKDSVKVLRSAIDYLDRY